MGRVMERVAGVFSSKVKAAATFVKGSVVRKPKETAQRVGKGIRNAANAVGTVALMSVPFLYVSANAGKSFLDADA